MKTTIAFTFSLFVLFDSLAQGDSWSGSRPDGHAPISVMGDHYHKKGGMMLAYRYMPMWMEGNLLASEAISNPSIFENYMVDPQSMQMDMHMLGLMYALSDRLTLMIMGNYISSSMNLSTMAGVDFTTSSSGFGDVSISALYKLINKNRQSLHANFGLSIPTASIDQRDDTPMMDNAQLAYPMQLGSGTYDPSIGLTYLGQSDKFSWGAQSTYKYRLVENSENYTFGNRFDLTGWGAIKVSKNLSLSTSLYYHDIQEISGADADLNAMMTPLFDAANSGRSQLDVGIGTNYYIPEGTFKNLRLAAEIKLPAIQQVNGIQMKNTWSTTLGIQYAFGTRTK